MTTAPAILELALFLTILPCAAARLSRRAPSRASAGGREPDRPLVCPNALAVLVAGFTNYGTEDFTPDLTPNRSRRLPSAAAHSGVAALTAPASGPYYRIRYAVPVRRRSPAIHQGSGRHVADARALTSQMTAKWSPDHGFRWSPDSAAIGAAIELFYSSDLGEWPSGKAPDSGSGYRTFGSFPTGQYPSPLPARSWRPPSPVRPPDRLFRPNLVLE
jgi:hypothetical protein